MGATQDVSAAVRVCIVESTNPEKVTVRVRIPDLDNLISYDLQVLQRKTRKDKDYWIPDLQEEVFCLFLGNGLECGFVLGALYNTEDKPPANSQDKQHTALSLSRTAPGLSTTGRNIARGRTWRGVWTYSPPATSTSSREALCGSTASRCDSMTLPRQEMPPSPWST